MRTLALQEMSAIAGGGFWAGFACGAGLVATVALIVAPDPSITKFAAGIVYTSTAAACGLAFA